MLRVRRRAQRFAPALVCLAGTLFAPAGPPAAAQTTYTWNGQGANSLLTNPANWVGGVAPPTGGGFPPSLAPILAFGGTANLSPTAPAGTYSPGRIVFNAGAGAFRLDAPAFLIGSTLAVINNSTQTQTLVGTPSLANPTFLTGVSLILNAAAGDLVVGGADVGRITVAGNANTKLDSLAFRSGFQESGPALTKHGQGTLTLGPLNTNHQVSISLRDGTTALVGAMNAPRAWLGLDSTPSPVLDSQGHDVRVRWMTGGGRVRLGAGTLTLSGDDELGSVVASAAAVDGEGGRLVKRGNAVVELTGALSYTGGTLIESGVIRAGNNLPTTGTVTVNTDYGLEFQTPAVTIGALAGTGALSITNLTAGGDGVDTNFDGLLRGGTLIKTGGGTMALRGHVYANLGVAAGTLTLGATSGGEARLYEGQFAVAKGATLRVLAANATVPTTQAGDFYPGLHYAPGLTVRNGGTLDLATDFTAETMMVDAGGTARIGGAFTLAAPVNLSPSAYIGGSVINGGGGAMSINGIGSGSEITIAGRGSVAVPITLFRAGLIVDGDLTTVTGPVTLARARNDFGFYAPTLTFTGFVNGPFTFAAPILVSGGHVDFQNAHGGRILAVSKPPITFSGGIHEGADGPGVLAFTQSSAASPTAVYILSAPGTLSSASRVDVQNGANLRVTNTTGLATGDARLEVYQGSLSGTGTIGQVVLARWGASDSLTAIRPGEEGVVGTLTARSLLVGGGTLRFDLGASSAASDQLVLSDFFNRNAFAPVTFDFVGPKTGMVAFGTPYTLVTGFTSTNLTAADFRYQGQSIVPFGQFSLVWNNDVGSLIFVPSQSPFGAVPEPGSAALMLAGVAAGGAACRRRRRAAARS